MNIKKVHWKDIRKPYLGEWSLTPGQDFVFTITKVENHVIKAGPMSDEKETPVLFSKEFEKGLVLNSTNAEVISKILGSGFVDDWIGKSVYIYREPQAKLVRGRKGPAIRVRTKLPAPTQKTLIDENHSNWENAVAAIQSGKSIDVIKERHTMTPEVEQKLLSYGK